MVVNESGRQRPLTQQERDQIEHDEMVEEEAAEMERQEDQRQWSLFAASSYRSWEEWAVSAASDGSPAKRARIQILVQGLGGRVVRDENWVVPLTEGEQLTYTVKVQPAAQDEEETGHPEAAPSGLHALESVPHEQVQTQEDERDLEALAVDGSTLPVTGWESAPVLENQTWPSKDLDVLEFVQTPLGIRFYREWVRGLVTCRLIGQRFGYGVLGKFYAIRDEARALRQLEGFTEEEAEAEARNAMTSAPASAAPLGGGGLDSARDALLPEGRDRRGAEGLDYEGSHPLPVGHDPTRAPSTSHGNRAQDDPNLAVTEGNVMFAEVLEELEGEEPVEAAASGAAAESATGSSEGANSRQTDLLHWLK